MRKKILKNIDWGVFICSVILCVIGMIALFSATQETGYDSLERQAIWFAISIPIVLILIFIDYDIIAKVSPVIYRNFYYIINCSFIYTTCKWSIKLV